MASEPIPHLPHFETPSLANQQFAPASGEFVGGDLPKATIDAIVRMTTILFPGDVHVELSIDPEDPQRPSFVFHVRQASRSLSIEEEIDSELDWHAQAGKLAPQCHDRLRLLLT